MNLPSGVEAARNVPNGSSQSSDDSDVDTVENVGSWLQLPTNQNTLPMHVVNQMDLGGRAFFRQRDAAAAGIHSRQLRRLVDDGAVERVARGLYRFTNAELTEHYTHAAVCARVAGAIICLLTALRIHDIGTQMPRQVWIAIPHKARQPRVPELPLRVVRFSGVFLRYGVRDTTFEGVPARITSPARTVVDCFRFRHVVGKDVALEALRDAYYERKATVGQIWRAAEACRAKSLVGPVLEALLG